MSDETIRTVCWAVCVLAAIQAFSIYCVVRLAVTGKAMFERRDHTEPMRGIHDIRERR